MWTELEKEEKSRGLFGLNDLLQERVVNEEVVLSHRRQDRSGDGLFSQSTSAFKCLLNSKPDKHCAIFIVIGEFSEYLCLQF